MRFFPALKYFYFLATNWNLFIAVHILKNEKRGEKKYGIDSIGSDDLSHLQDLDIDITHSTLYMPASYDMLEDFFTKAGVQHAHHFLDIGCGKGRAMVVAAEYGAKKVSGVELSGKLIAAARKNLAAYKMFHPEKNIQLFHNDACYFDIAPDVDFIFLFNPFDEVLMNAVMENILESLRKSKRKIKVIYFNPLHKEVFTGNGFREIFHWKKLKYLEGIIVENE